MARSVWNGTLGFGLLNIPVALYTSVREQDLSFKQLCPEHRVPIAMKRCCSHDDAELAFVDLAKGFEVAAGEYVVLTEEDMERAALPLSKSFDIRLFVPESEVDLRFFHTPYFVVPKAEGVRTYALLREAIRRTGRLAVGKIALKTKQQIAALRVSGSALVLQLMHWPDELVAPEFGFPGEMHDPAELALAEQLVAGFDGALAGEEWTDEYRANLERIIEARVRGEEVEFTAAPSREATDVIDLVAVLRASLAARKAA
jgi:DNA end-binding protein Ku